MPQSLSHNQAGPAAKDHIASGDDGGRLTPGFRDAISGDTPEAGFAAAAELLVADAVKARATDIHLDPRKDTMAVRLRIDGVLYDALDLPKPRGLHVLRHLQVSAGIDAATKPDVHDGHAAVSLGDRKVNLRVASIPSVLGDKLSIRVLDPGRTPFRLEELGLDRAGEEQLRTWVRQAVGMLLVTGPTGSGKTTTLYALLNELARENRNIITLEDPVELTLGSINQVQIDQSNSPSNISFAGGLTRVLRHDPDVIAVGEVRDAETAEIAIDAALSGHILLSSLNARDAAGAVSLLRNLGVKDYQIVAALRVLISQRTFRLLCDSCRSNRPPSGAERAWIEENHLETPDRVFDAPGCDRCLGTGYRGLTAAFELWNIDENGHDLLLDHADEKSLRAHLREIGVRSIRDNALAKARAGKVSLADVACLR